MEQPDESHATQDEKAAPPEKFALGAVLRERREHLGLSIADVASQTKLAPRQIEALEAEDFRHLPEMPFVRGFVRSYAKILQQNPQPLLAALPHDEAPVKPLTPHSVEAPFPTAHTAQQQNLILLGMALLLSVLVVAFAVWHFTSPPAKPPAAKNGAVQRQSNEAPTLAAPAPEADKKPRIRTAQSAPSPADKPETQQTKILTAKMETPEIMTTPAEPDHPALSPETAPLRLLFDEESWVEAKDKEGNVLSSQINPRGSQLLLEGQAPFSLVIGRATSVQLYYRGQPVDLTPHIRRSTDVAFLTLE